MGRGGADELSEMLMRSALASGRSDEEAVIDDALVALLRNPKLFWSDRILLVIDATLSSGAAGATFADVKRYFDAAQADAQAAIHYRSLPSILVGGRPQSGTRSRSGCRPARRSGR